MKAKQHTLIVLLVFVLSAGAALTLLTHANQKAEQAASEAEDGSIPLLDVTTATLESVSIQYGGETLTLRPADDGWTLTEDPAYHLDDSACNTIRTALAGMKARRQLEAQPGEDYGFDAPRLVVNVSAAGESTTLTVGAENPVTGDVYVRREGGDAVYTVDAARFRCMEQTKAELFGAFSPAGITVSDIEAVRYTLQSGETIKLQSVSQPTEADSTTYQTVWQLTDEPNAALDTDKTDALLAALASYVTGQNTAADLSSCGFDAPLVTAEVTTADGTVTLTYAIGTDGYYMMVSGDSSVYTVDGQTVQALCRDVDVIVGAKDSSGDIENLKAYIRLTRELDKDVAILAGNDGAILTCLKEGGAGGIAGRANIWPATVAKIYDCFKAGDLEGAQAAQDAIAILQQTFKYGNPNTIIKTAVALQGHNVGKCRAPFNYVPEEGLEAIKKVLAENAAKGLN